MSDMFTTVLSLLGAAFLGVIGWAFRLQTQVTIHAQKHDDLTTLLDAKFDAVTTLVDAKFEASDRRLERIERALNGALHRS